MTEVHSCLDNVTSLDQRPIISELVGRLHLLQRMAECILAQILEVVTRSDKIRRAEIDGVVGRTGNADLLGHVGLPGQRTYAATLRAHVVNLGLVDHARTYSPGVM